MESEPPLKETPPEPRMVTPLSVSYWRMAAVIESATSPKVSAPERSMVAAGPPSKRIWMAPVETPRPRAPATSLRRVAAESAGSRSAKPATRPVFEPIAPPSPIVSGAVEPSRMSVMSPLPEPMER
jgi:hypothetical protein